MAVIPRDAASIILLRNRADPEVFWVKRNPTLSVMAGFHTFPGGQLDPADSAVAVDGCDDPQDALRRVCAVRELFEETGVLIAEWPGGIHDERLSAMRSALCSEQQPFDQMLGEIGARIVASSLEPSGRWVTPPFAPRRFDTWFFVGWLPAHQQAAIEDGELELGEWIKPRDALAMWGRGEAILAPPTLHALRTLAACSNRIDEAAELMRTPPEANRGLVRRIEFGRGIFFFPVRTPTLPPATHTNCYIVGGEELLVIDPASPYEDERDRLDEFIDELAAEGRRVREIIITHHHSDHVGGVNHLRSRLGVPVAAQKLTAQRLRSSVPVDRTIEDGELIEISGDPGWRLRALHTPGHTRGHLCFYEENSAAVITGDLVVGAGTVIIDPPEGNMRQYLDSLNRLLELPRLGSLFGAHGPAVGPGRLKINEYIAHRLARERKILDAVGSGSSSIQAVVKSAYDDVQPSLHGLAERSALAHLEKLEEEGFVRKTHAGYAPA
jgi:glyoxylase-like metal-dependent hydrolase (beta-lactamase superfamily II)/8-oxo-dGTP pyrophosphatase MutT (NUDIX family)